MDISVVYYNCKVSPQKAQLVAKEMRGGEIDRVVNFLSLMNNKVSKCYLKLLKSAVSNIENNHSLDYKDFVVSVATADKGRVLKRVMPRAKGRADRITKRYSHLGIVLTKKGVS